MDLHEAIRQRRSIRSYADKAVESDKLQRVLEAGRLSPSARNRQARKLIVVRQQDIRRRLAEAAEQEWIADAPVVIAIVGTQPGYVMSCGTPADPVDCAIAVDHMTLAATAEGLGSCWIGHFDQARVADALAVPDENHVVQLLTLGYAAGPGGAPSRKSLEEIVCYERFA